MMVKKYSRGFAFMRLLKILILTLVAVTAVMFILENQTPVNLSFLGWGMPQLPVSVFITLALLFGLAVGPVLCWYANLRRPKSL